MHKFKMKIYHLRSDWCEELEWYARKLGYVYQKPEAAILQMLRKIPEELVCGFQPQENGGIAFRLKVTPKECTRSVLAVIDATNQRQEYFCGDLHSVIDQDGNAKHYFQYDQEHSYFERIRFKDEKEGAEILSENFKILF